jgi:thiamine pyrophosphokinase
MMPDESRMHVPTLMLIHKVAETLKFCTAPMNEIMQIIESYTWKAGSLQSKLRALELEDITTFATNLKLHSTLSSEDTAKVVIAWMEENAVKQVNGASYAVKAVEAVVGSVRILFANTSVLDAIKAVMKGSGEKGSN